MSDQAITLQELDDAGISRAELRRLGVIVRGLPGEEYALADELRAAGVPVPDDDD